MILSFKQQFINKIIAGNKIHTIREDKHNRWKQGNKIHFATGARTKNYKQFKSGVCKNIQPIKIRWRKGGFEQIGVWIDGALKFTKDGMLHNGSNFMDQLAKNDGFKNYDDFFKWFNKDFDGKIIHWTDFKY